MREKFDVTLGVVAYIIANILIFFGIVVSCILISVSERVNNQLSDFRTDTKQQLSVLTQKLEEKENKVLVYRVKKQEESSNEDENACNRVECILPY